MLGIFYLISTIAGWFISREIKPEPFEPEPEPRPPRWKGRNFRFVIRWLVIGCGIFLVLMFVVGFIFKQSGAKNNPCKFV